MKPDWTKIWCQWRHELMKIRMVDMQHLRVKENKQLFVTLVANMVLSMMHCLFSEEKNRKKILITILKWIPKFSLIGWKILFSKISTKICYCSWQSFLPHKTYWRYKTCVLNFHKIKVCSVTLEEKIAFKKKRIVNWFLT